MPASGAVQVPTPESAEVSSVVATDGAVTDGQ
jgi:hypothetical protein